MQSRRAPARARAGRRAVRRHARDLLDGPVRALAWAITTTGFAILARRLVADRDPARPEHDEALLAIRLGGHLLLSSARALVLAPPGTLAASGNVELAGLRRDRGRDLRLVRRGPFAGDVRRGWRIALDAVAMAGAAYLSALALDGPVLAAAVAGQAILLGMLAARGRDPVAAWGGGAYLGLALAHLLLFEAPLEALVTGLDDPRGAALALGAVALAAIAAVAPLYLASALLVTPFQPGDGAPLAGVLDLGVRQLGQVLLSGLWAIVGLVTLVIGLRRDERMLRLGSLSLLLVTVAKVFLYDLAALTSLYRVGSFIALGLLLLVAAGVWQRMRPRPLPDLRATPPALR
ncbi:MAG: hypothetical protein QOD83_2929 [Solirubrobacteraceae bacterium]|nr:hypothetical protein [Solirubrobacteraceae bacterium]